MSEIKIEQKIKILDPVKNEVITAIYKGEYATIPLFCYVQIEGCEQLIIADSRNIKSV